MVAGCLVHPPIISQHYCWHTSISLHSFGGWFYYCYKVKRQNAKCRQIIEAFVTFPAWHRSESLAIWSKESSELGRNECEIFGALWGSFMRRIEKGKFLITYTYWRLHNSQKREVEVKMIQQYFGEQTFLKWTRSPSTPLAIRYKATFPYVMLSVRW